MKPAQPPCQWCREPIVGKRFGASYCSTRCGGLAGADAQVRKAAVDPEYAERRAEWDRAKVARYNARNPESLRERNRRRTHHNGRRRALVRGAFVEDVDRLRVWLLGLGRCGICDKFVDVDRMHIDHVVALVNGGEHSYINVQPAHPVCNLRKSAR